MVILTKTTSSEVVDSTCTYWTREKVQVDVPVNNHSNDPSNPQPATVKKTQYKWKEQSVLIKQKVYHKTTIATTMAEAEEVAISAGADKFSSRPLGPLWACDYTTMNRNTFWRRD